MSLLKLFLTSFLFFFALLGLMSVGSHSLSWSDLSPLLSLGLFAAMQAAVLIVLERVARSRKDDHPSLVQ